MNPRAIACWVAAALFVSLASQNPCYRLLVLGAAALVVTTRRRPLTRVRPVLIGVGVASLMAVAFNLALSHTGSNVLVSLPGWIPAVGGPLTLEGAAYGADVGLGLAACFLAGCSLSLVADPYQLVDALPGWLAGTAAALGAAMTLVPRLGHSFVAVREAQQMRGWRPWGLRSWTAVVVPSVLTAIEGSVLLAEAMESRAFGSGRRSGLEPMRWRWSDRVVLALALLAAAGFSLALALGQAQGWQPYPNLTLPGLELLPAGCCLLLLAPALVR